VSIEPGALHVVATPIGHRDDLGARARAVLAGADLVAAEDTRHTGSLLAHLGIHAELRSLHEHNEAARIPELIAHLQAGGSVALVSDAGTPAVSDPGYRLVVAAHEAGIRVVPIPGPSAVTAALAVAGQPTDRFLFAGFPPAKSGSRQQWLRDLASEAATLVLFESCHRVEASLGDLVTIFGADRPATLCRELTKRFETVHRSTLGGLVEFVQADPNQHRGEIVLVIAGADTPASTAQAIDLETALDALLPELPPARAAAVAARLTGVPKKEAYRAAMARKG
jgi:16S rRNA (cytidine1402-2'-O)-methyltransferase